VAKLLSRTHKHGGCVSHDDAPQGDGRRNQRPPPGQDPNPGDDLRRSYGLMGIGTEFVAAIAVPTVIGLLADRWLKTLPWLTLVGVFFGFALGIMQMVRLGRRGNRD
jgi:F0F1-type ATP synthase assembly protein I